MKKKDVLLYKFVRPIATILFKFVYRPTIIGVENIPKDGKIILAGNHTSILDCVMLMSSTKRNIHYLAKKELFSGVKKIFFSNMGLIPVDRSIHDKTVLPLAEEYLNNGCVIGIFPEGTTEKGIKKLLPFKTGAVRLSYTTKTKIVPFKIIGDYKPFKKSITLVFGKSFKSTKDIDASNKKLYDIINKMKVSE